MPPSASLIRSSQNWRRNSRYAAGAIVFCVAALAAAAGPLARFLIVRSEPLSGDALVVLAGSPLYNERIEHAIELYKHGRARAIILTNDGVRGGWSRRHQRNVSPMERGSDAILEAGINAASIVLLRQRVRSTYDEAVAVRAALQASAIRRVVIVTSAYHSRRALWIFRRVLENDGVLIGIDPVPPGRLTPPPEAWWRSRRGWHSVALEYMKLPYYLLRHG